MRIRLLPMTLWVVAISACQKPPSDLREWRATDHDSTPAANQAAPAPTPPPQATGQAGGAGGAPGSVSDALAHRGLNEQILEVWVARCTTCHGTIGRGDGPQSSAVRARDLSDPAWQQATSDAAIQTAIVKGKGAMPAFALPPETLQGLTNLVRLFAQRPSERVGQ